MKNFMNEVNEVKLQARALSSVHKQTKKSTQSPKIALSVAVTPHINVAFHKLHFPAAPRTPYMDTNNSPE